MKIAFCIITKGDEELSSLKRCLASVDGHVDTIHVLANRDHEETKKWCESKKYDFKYSPWEDSFSQQRNLNFSMAPKDADYIMWADCDDVVIGADLIRETAERSMSLGLEAVFFKYWYGCTFSGEPSEKTLEKVDVSQERERLLKNGAFEWKKRLHESPVPKDGTNSKYSSVDYDETPIVWLHLGADRYMSDEASNNRTARNKRLLEMDLADERANGGEADPRTLLYLMKIYAEEEDVETLKKCLDMGGEYLSKSGWDAERATCLHLMTNVYGKLGNTAKATQTAFGAIKEYPTDPISYLYLARCLYVEKKYSQMEHWMKVGMSLKMPKSSQAYNLLEMEVLSAQLLLQFYLNVKKNVRKAYESAKMLLKLDPTQNNQDTVDLLYDRKELDIACEHAHNLMKYYEEIGRKDQIPKLCLSLPKEMQMLPFSVRAFNKFKEPKIWGKDEICYYATFGGSHFENWDPTSLKRGIGGSETAVIKLSEEWAKSGYKVTVYGDPVKPYFVDYGTGSVTYLPWYMFNPRDYFNIFIQWRFNNLCGQINSRKFVVDLHDVFSDHTYIGNEDKYDSIMVKSNFHKEMAKGFKNQKAIKVISNGI